MKILRTNLAPDILMPSSWAREVTEKDVGKLGDEVVVKISAIGKSFAVGLRNEGEWSCSYKRELSPDELRRVEWGNVYSAWVQLGLLTIHHSVDLEE